MRWMLAMIKRLLFRYQGLLWNTLFSRNALGALFRTSTNAELACDKRNGVFSHCVLHQDQCTQHFAVQLTDSETADWRISWNIEKNPDDLLDGIRSATIKAASRPKYKKLIEHSVLMLDRFDHTDHFLASAVKQTYAAYQGFTLYYKKKQTNKKCVINARPTFVNLASNYFTMNDNCRTHSDWCGQNWL